MKFKLPKPKYPEPLVFSEEPEYVGKLRIERISDEKLLSKRLGTP